MYGCVVRRMALRRILPSNIRRCCFGDVLLTAITQIRANKLRSFFTLLGIIVSVAFLVAVVAVIQGMNAYVKENVADALIGSNTFQVRRVPINIGLIEDADWLRMQRRPKITAADADVVRAAHSRCRRDRRAVRLSHATQRHRVARQDARLRADQRRHAGVSADSGLPLRLRRSDHGGRRPRAAARRGRRRRHHRQAVRRTQSGRRNRFTCTAFR